MTCLSSKELWGYLEVKLFFIFFLLFISQINAGWQDRRCEGWAYFEEKSKPEESEEEIVEDTKQPTEVLESCKKEMENKFAQAVLEPSEDNILEYLELQHQWLKRAGKVSQVWAKVILQNPTLDNSLSGMPVSSYGTKFYHKQKSIEQKQTVKQLSESHSILCFYEGKKESSKEFSKVIKIFSKRHNWVVQPISIDGVLLDEFPGSILDQGLRDKLEVTHFPSVYVFDPYEGDAKPVGFGLVSVDMLETNIGMQFR